MGRIPEKNFRLFSNCLISGQALLALLYFRNKFQKFYNVYRYFGQLEVIFLHAVKYWHTFSLVRWKNKNKKNL